VRRRAKFGLARPEDCPIARAMAMPLPEEPKRCRRRTEEGAKVTRARPPRQAKVVELRRPGRGHGATEVAVPWLQPSGRWLAEAGFGVGQKFEIGVEPGRPLLEAVAE